MGGPHIWDQPYGWINGQTTGKRVTQRVTVVPWAGGIRSQGTTHTHTHHTATRDTMQRDARFKVILASLEHSLPHLGCKAQAGGLGKVMDLVARHHPTDLLMVHPKLKEDETLKYSHDLELPSLSITVDNQQQDVRVLYCKPPADDSPTRSRRGFLLLSHSWFEERPKTAIYPESNDPEKGAPVLLSVEPSCGQTAGALQARYS